LNINANNSNVIMCENKYNVYVHMLYMFLRYVPNIHTIFKMKRLPKFSTNILAEKKGFAFDTYICAKKVLETNYNTASTSQNLFLISAPIDKFSNLYTPLKAYKSI